MMLLFVVSWTMFVVIDLFSLFCSFFSFVVLCVCRAIFNLLEGSRSSCVRLEIIITARSDQAPPSSQEASNNQRTNSFLLPSSKMNE